MKGKHRRKKKIKKLSWEDTKKAIKVRKMCRGFEAEDKFFEVFEKFKRRSKTFINNRSILFIERTAHYSVDDKNGKDFIVKFIKNGEIEEISIQVKNWIRPGMKEWFKKKGICFMHIPTNNDKPSNLIFKVINNYLRRKDEAEARYNKKKIEQIIVCQKLSIFNKMALWVKNFWENCKVKAMKKVNL